MSEKQSVFDDLLGDDFAFPMLDKDWDVLQLGLTTLDYFAAAISPAIYSVSHYKKPDDLAKLAYDYAAAMLREKDRRDGVVDEE